MLWPALAGLWLLFGARCILTICLSCWHSRGLLANRGCRHLPLCFAPAPSATSDQSSKLGAALRCEAGANIRLHVCHALTGAACQQRLPPPSSPLCTRAVREFSTNGAGLGLLFCERRMHTICKSDVKEGLAEPSYSCSCPPSRFRVML